LDGDNRALVRAGLGALARGQRPGTRALVAIAGCRLFVPTGEDVSFRLVPRINAPGRLEKPDAALQLLLATDDGEARRLAAEVEMLCSRRKEIQHTVSAEAFQMMEDGGLRGLPGVVVAKQGWHPGVVGIVAGRLCSFFRKPTVVIALDGARGRGSARAPAGFSIYDALSRARETLLGFGGHHAAAGIEVQSHLVDSFRDRFMEACFAMGPAGGPFHDEPDALLEDGDPPARVMAELERFEPCGHANPAPRILIETMARRRRNEAVVLRRRDERSHRDSRLARTCHGRSASRRVDGRRRGGNAPTRIGAGMSPPPSRARR
jgi:single-stranded-DNA-specific exonuclease